MNDAEALPDNATCNCQWSGQISVVDAGQSDVKT